MMDLSEAVNYWLEWHYKATAEWPWRFHVLNVEQSAKTVCPGASPERFADLLIAVSNTVEEAAAKGSTDYVAFAKLTNGWKRGEKSIMRRLCDAVPKSDCDSFKLSKLGVVVETIADITPFPTPGNDDPWSIKESAKNTPLQTLIWLIDMLKSGGVLDVPFDEWRHAERDFRPLAIFKLIIGSATPHHEIGERFSSSDQVKTTNCVALHTPRGSRDTARKSARVLQARIYLELMKSVYRQHSEAVRQAWSTADDPVLQLICSPTRATVEKALLFLWTETDRQHRRLADKTGEVKTVAVTWHEADETPPGEYPAGPLKGTKRQLAKWIMEDDDPRNLDTKLKYGIYWGREEKRTLSAVWFREQGKYADANKRRLDDPD